MTYSDIEKSFENTSFSKEQKAFIIAKTWNEFLQNQEEEINKKIIAENDFFYSEDWKRAKIKKGDRITNFNDICMISKDKKQWNKYYTLFYAECQKRGIARAYNEVITSVSRRLYLSAGDILIDWFLNEVKKYQSKNPLLTAFDYDFSKSDEIKKSLFGRKKILELAMKWKSQE